MENMTFEQLLNELNKVVESLESGKLSLEESVEVYQKGMALSIECKKRLDAAKEVIVKKVTSEGETDLK
ncbi:MAG: exodeoxyribonuclease VII small subunit [Bacilli bacterium]|jgi:exodeoxyribonuclease VII small subunit|nr:exodeoxyribonuclease VII small subunit [Bacilli bacterium]